MQDVVSVAILIIHNCNVYLSCHNLPSPRWQRIKSGLRTVLISEENRYIEKNKKKEHIHGVENSIMSTQSQSHRCGLECLGKISERQ